MKRKPPSCSSPSPLFLMLTMGNLTSIAACTLKRNTLVNYTNVWRENIRKTARPHINYTEKLPFSQSSLKDTSSSKLPTDMKENKTCWQKYFLYFAHDFVDFRTPEINSILSFSDIQLKWLRPPSEEPYWFVEMPSDEEVCKLALRSVLLRCAVKLWSHADNLEQLHSQLKESHIETCEKTLKSKSFKVHVETYGKHISHQERVDKIETFSYLPLDGLVKLNDPDVTLFYLEYYGLDSNNVPEKPYELVFGELLVNGQRDLVSKFSLKKRKFIGNTSMDPQLAFLMANQARVIPGSLVLDPFVGSGSLLVSAAHWGAYVLGTDINYLMLHARTKPTRKYVAKREADESVLANMKQYGCSERYVDVVVADSSLPIWTDSLTLDAIITDPPYGVRESTDRIGSSTPHEISNEQAGSHIPSKVNCNLQQVFNDLLDFSAKHLRLNGRLVCFLPVFREDYSDEMLPRHPSFELVANSEQILSAVSSRRLLTYEKVLDLTDITESQESVRNAVSNLDLFRKRYFEHGDETRKDRREKKYSERYARASNDDSTANTTNLT